eukprot:CAMPEP_0182565642 /NCGR_PEP_ID=MMETSP1324-20130603/7313_1 /TAXON_ID=236786 /ORGANISM="Florenciella sp., Strain RCC1587" /LENGTH=79 /DNA_ID=CAMNT_0024779331 /DNA_START=1 /DNA_END=236 /DNA_ORIENTATION=+
MKRRRTSYRTVKSTCTLVVSDFWVISWEGPKRQPGFCTGFEARVSKQRPPGLSDSGPALRFAKDQDAHGTGTSAQHQPP